MVMKSSITVLGQTIVLANMSSLTMKIKIRKTDARFTGSELFHYVADVVAERYNIPVIGGLQVRLSKRLTDFNEVRAWCIQTWGMSCERSSYLEIAKTDASNLNTHWAWHTEFGETKIYMTTDKEVNWFKLKWL